MIEYLKIGKRFKYCSSMYTYEFVIVSTDNNKIRILVDGTKIYSVKLQEIEAGINIGSVKELW